MHRATSNRDQGTRGEDRGLTCTRIRYPSPPRRTDEEVLQYLTKDRKLGKFRPRHTPPDVCAAQDVALGKARILDLAIRSTQVSRRDSGVNEDVCDGKKEHQIPDPDPRDDALAVKPPPLAPPSRRSATVDLLSAPSNKTLQSAREASPKRTFSEMSSPAPSPQDDGPEYRPRPPPSMPPGRVKKTTASPAPSSFDSRQPADQRTGRGRKAPLRPSELRNLGVDAKGLDPNRREPVVRKLYLSKGKWYEVTGSGRPDWAEDEKEEIVSTALHSSKRSRASLSRNAH